MARLGGLMVVPILCLIAYDIQVASSGGYPNPWDEAHTLFLSVGPSRPGDEASRPKKEPTIR